MKMYTKVRGRKKETITNVPNAIAFTFIRNFLQSKDFDDMRAEYCIDKLNKEQINQMMTDIKWLFKNYKNLEVLITEDTEHKIVKFIL